MSPPGRAAPRAGPAVPPCRYSCAASRYSGAASRYGGAGRSRGGGTCRCRGGWDAGECPPGGPGAESQADEVVVADQAGLRIEELTAQRQLGGAVQPEPGGQAAVTAERLDNPGPPPVLRAHPGRPHRVVGAEQADQRRGEAERCGRLLAGLVAVNVGPGTGGRGHPGERADAVAVPHVNHDPALPGAEPGAAAARCPPGDDLHALVGDPPRCLDRLVKQPDSRGQRAAAGGGRRGAGRLAQCPCLLPVDQLSHAALGC